MSSLLRLTEKIELTLAPYLITAKTFCCMLNAEETASPWPFIKRNNMYCSWGRVWCFRSQNLLCECQEHKKKFNLTEPLWPWIVFPPLMLLEQQYCSLRLREILAAWGSTAAEAGRRRQTTASFWNIRGKSGAAREAKGATSRKFDRNKEMKGTVVQGLIEELGEKINLPVF